LGGRRTATRLQLPQVRADGFEHHAVGINKAKRIEQVVGRLQEPSLGHHQRRQITRRIRYFGHETEP